VCSLLRVGLLDATVAGSVGEASDNRRQVSGDAGFRWSGALETLAGSVAQVFAEPGDGLGVAVEAVGGLEMVAVGVEDQRVVLVQFLELQS
jgi:hypothetical protein